MKTISNHHHPLFSMKYSRFLLATISVGTLILPTAKAATATWAGTVGNNWASSGNWSTGVVPGAGDTIVGGSAANSTTNTGPDRQIANLLVSLNNQWVIQSSTTGTSFVVTGTLSKTNSSNFTLRTNIATPLNVSIGTLDVGSGATGQLIFGSNSGQTSFALGTLTIGTTNLSAVTTSIFANSANLGNATMTNNAILTIFSASNGTGNVTVNSLASSSANTSIQTSTVAGSTAAGILTIQPASGTSSYAGVLRDSDGSNSASLAVVKTGAGAQELTNVNTYSAGTTISAGTLLVSGTGTIGTGSLTMNGGTFDISGISGSTYVLGTSQTLSGMGVINATGKSLQVAGTLTPGASPGTLTINGGLSMAGTTQINLEINGTTAGLFDSIVVNGTVILDGTLNLSTGYSATFGNTVQIFDADTIAGSFDTITGTTLGGGLSWDISSLYIDGTISVVPEPGTAGLFSAGIAFALLRRRKSRYSL